MAGAVRSTKYAPGGPEEGALWKSIAPKDRAPCRIRRAAMHGGRIAARVSGPSAVSRDGGGAIRPDYPRFPATDRTIRAVLLRSASATPGCTGSESTAWAALCVAESGRAGRRVAVS